MCTVDTRDHISSPDLNLVFFLSVRGYWREEERALPQHLLELKAVYLALKIFCKFQNNVHMQVNLDDQVCCHDSPHSAVLRSEK